MHDEGYSYRADELYGHVRHLEAVQEDLDAIVKRDSGAVPNVFGFIGSSVPSLLQPLEDRSKSLLQATYNSVLRSSQTMRLVVDDYERVDEEAASSFEHEE